MRYWKRKRKRQNQNFIALTKKLTPVRRQSVFLVWVLVPSDPQ